MVNFLLMPYRAICDLGKLIIIYWPGELGFGIRRFYYKSRGMRLGNNVKIEIGVHIEGAQFISMGDNVHIDKYCIISAGIPRKGKIYKKANNFYFGNIGEIRIGDNVHICQFCILMGYGGLSVGDNSVTSAGVKIYSLTNIAYDFNSPEQVISIQPYDQAPFLLSPVVIEKNVWLGLHVVVMPSVTIGKNSFCSANSVVMDKFADNSYLAGQPAVVLRKRFDNTARNKTYELYSG